MFFDTEAESTAVDFVILPIWSRRVQIGWKSGSVATYQVRRRDQLKAALMSDTISWGRFANWCLIENEIEGIASLRNSHG